MVSSGIKSTTFCFSILVPGFLKVTSWFKMAEEELHQKAEKVVGSALPAQSTLYIRAAGKCSLLISGNNVSN